MSKINKIRLSGTDYDIQDVSATSVVEVTQQQYDDLPASAKTDNILYIITDSTVDYVTSAQTQSAITQAVSGKVDTSTYTAYTAATDTALANKQTTLTAGTGISIVDNVISATGGGSSYTAGDGIDITNDVISVTGKADTSAVTAIQDSLSGYVTTDTEQIISGRKIFTYSASSSKAIEFKQTDNSAKVGFRVRTSAATNNELASFEFRPNTFTVDGVQHPLLYFGHYRSTAIANAGVPQTYIGFRQYDQLNAAAYHYLIPLPEKAKTPFNLTTSFKDYYAPMGFKNGSTMITADDTGVVDLSSEFSGKADTATTYTKTEVDTALASKQTTLTAGTGIDITDNVISATGGGGGGKAVEAGRGISITTGATADTVSFNLPISAGTGSDSIIEGSGTTASGNRSHAEGEGTYAFGIRSHAEGYQTIASGWGAHAEGNSTQANAGYSHAEGNSTMANGAYSHAEGQKTTANNQSEHASGQYNVSSSASTTFGDSGNTLFSVGNGTADDARHNAFEIRQNGDIYLSSGGTDIKLQDHLGGGGSSYTAGDGINISNENVISVTGKVDTSAITTSVTSSSTDAQVPSAKAVNDKLGGLKLVKLTQSAYDALAPNYDSNTLYVING